MSILRHIYGKKVHLKSLAKPNRVRVPVAQGIYKKSGRTGEWNIAEWNIAVFSAKADLLQHHAKSRQQARPAKLRKNDKERQSLWRGKGGGRGPKSYDWKKAWFSIIHPILFVPLFHKLKFDNLYPIQFALPEICYKKSSRSMIQFMSDTISPDTICADHFVHEPLQTHIGPYSDNFLGFSRTASFFA